MQYLDKRREMRQSGYSERDIADSFAFLYIEDDKQVSHGIFFFLLFIFFIFRLVMAFFFKGLFGFCFGLL